MKFEVYTYFGRVLKTFEVPEGQTHHETLEEARQFGLNSGRGNWWIRLVGSTLT